MDRILVLDHGRLVEDDPHEHLLAADGLYAKLYSMEFAADAPGEPSPLHRTITLGHTPAEHCSEASDLAPRR